MRLSSYEYSDAEEIYLIYLLHSGGARTEKWRDCVAVWDLLMFWKQQRRLDRGLDGTLCAVR